VLYIVLLGRCMNSISANELKTKGVSIVENVLQNEDEAIITVRGKQKYVIIDLKKYSKMREYELEIALLEARADLIKGHTKKESVADHMKRVMD
jgi:prevent-host-death family protein